MPQFRCFGMVLGNDTDIRPDENIILDGDPASVQKSTTGIDKHVLPKPDKTSEHCVKRKKHTHRFVYILSGQSAEHHADFTCRVICPVQLLHQTHTSFKRFIQFRILRVAFQDKLSGSHSFKNISHTFPCFLFTVQN